MDVIVEIKTYSQLDKLSKKLKANGFKEDTRKGAPICRWRISSLVIDIMPIDQKVLGFSNSYYEKGFSRRESYQLPSGRNISRMPINEYLGSKIEAFNNRGKSEPRMSKDLEDIVSLLLDSDEFEINSEIKKQLHETFSSNINQEAIRGFVTRRPKQSFKLLLQLVK